MYYYDNNYFGMHLVWWIIWGILLIWIFATPYDIPGQRKRRDTPLHLLKKRFAAGEITKEAYEEGKKIIENP
jgi:putative membrane protein